MHSTKIFLLLLLLAAFSCTSTHSGMKSITSGDADAYLKQTPKAQEHPNAGAIVLFTYKYIEYFDDGTSILRRAERIKIFNERGRGFAIQAISYREGYSRVKILYANTITPQGKIIALNTKDIHDASAHAGYDFYTDIKEKRFTMPAVEDGCVIEFAYEIKNLKTTLPFDLSGRFFLQDFHPIEENILEVVLPEDIDLKYKNFHTTLTPQITQEGGKKKYLFKAHRQQEILKEARMPDLRDRNTFPEITFWTMTNWDIISKWYIKVVYEQMKPNPELLHFTRQLIAGKKKDEEKIKEIFSFVSQKVRYVSVSLGPHTHEPHAASEIFQKRYGDCKDKTTLLLAMLKIAGIEGLPVLVPSHPDYFDETIPSLDVFDHVIAVVPLGGKYFWLDATKETASCNSPPFLRPTIVYVIQADGSHRFLKTPAPDDKKDFSNIDSIYRINEEGDADVDLTLASFGMTAEDIRHEFKYMSPEDRRKSFEERRGIEVRDVSFTSFTNTDEPFIIKVKGNIKNYVQKLDEEIMVLTGAIGMDSFRDITAAKHRHYPVVFNNSFYARFNDSFIFPAGFKIKKLPQALTLDKPFQYRRETYDFHGSTFNISISNKEKEQKIMPDHLEDFKTHAILIQKRESALRNIVLEKK